jgi:hypothetical protein
MMKQLSLFPETETKTFRPRIHPPALTVIELQCSTKRASTLLEVSTSTLTNAKKKGKLPYQKGAWIATFAGKKGKKSLFWTVSFHR